MSAATSTSSDEPSAAGRVYQGMVKDLLAAEYDRRAKMEARGSTIVTASASLATLVFGLTVVLTGKDHTFTNSFATLPLIAALVAFVISAVLGTMAQNYPFGYWTISSKSLAQLTSSTFWNRPADYAVRDDISQQVKTISTMREANQKTARLVTISLGFQVIAIILLSVSVALDLYGRTSLSAEISGWLADYSPFFATC